MTDIEKDKIKLEALLIFMEKSLIYDSYDRALGECLAELFNNLGFSEKEKNLIDKNLDSNNNLNTIRQLKNLL